VGNNHGVAAGGMETLNFFSLETAESRPDRDAASVQQWAINPHQQAGRKKITTNRARRLGRKVVSAPFPESPIQRRPGPTMRTGGGPESRNDGLAHFRHAKG